MFLAPVERRRNHIFRSLEASKATWKIYFSGDLECTLTKLVFVLVKTYLMVKKLNSAPGGADELPRRKAEQSKPVKKREIKFVFLFEYKFLICIFFFLNCGVCWSDIRGISTVADFIKSLTNTLQLDFHFLLFSFF